MSERCPPPQKLLWKALGRQFNRQCQYRPLDIRMELSQTEYLAHTARGTTSHTCDVSRLYMPVGGYFLPPVQSGHKQMLVSLNSEGHELLRMLQNLLAKPERMHNKA